MNSPVTVLGIIVLFSAEDVLKNISEDILVNIEVLENFWQNLMRLCWE